MDMDDDNGEKTKLREQALDDEVRRAVADGAEMTYYSLTRLLAALRPIEMREDLRDGITSDFAALGRPVPWDAQWHWVPVRTDRVPNGTWCFSTRPDSLLPGYCIVVACDRNNYALARQNRRDLVAKKLYQAALN